MMNFEVLDPRKAKREAIAANLAGLGPATWLKAAPIGLGTGRRAVEVAAEAAAMSKARGWSYLREKANIRLLTAQYAASHARFKAKPDAVAVCWNGLNGTRRTFMEAARDAGARRLFFELAPLPGRITADPKGVNDACSLPRRTQPYLDWAKTECNPNRNWRAIVKDIKQRQASVSGRASSVNLPPLTDQFVMVALQTPGDSQLRLFGGSFNTVEAFVEACLEASSALPANWHIRFKEHPTAPTDIAPILEKYGGGRAFVDNATDTFTLVRQSRAVLTVNSSVGLEAMMFDKPVVACGQAFWAFEGLADVAPDTHTLISVCAAAGDLGFDANARDAFLDYLDQVYYPPRTGAPDLIAARLNGTDPFGFWDTKDQEQ